MLLPNRFLLPVMVVKCLFLLPQPLDMIAMELFQTFVIKFGFDWSVFCLHDSGTDTTDGIVRTFCCGIECPKNGLSSTRRVHADRCAASASTSCMASRPNGSGDCAKWQYYLLITENNPHLSHLPHLNGCKRCEG